MTDMAKYAGLRWDCVLAYDLPHDRSLDAIADQLGA
jgi:hypothetical protein